MLAQDTLYGIFLAQTKIDQSFTKDQFDIMGFKCHWTHRNGHGGGIVAFICNDLPHRRLNDVEMMIAPPFEPLIIEVIIRNQSCFYLP